MKAEIILNHDYIIGEPDGMLFGSFVEHIGRSVYTGIYEPDHYSADEYGFRGDVAQLVRGLGISGIRYPGGNFVSGYNWENGVGPRVTRPKTIDVAWNCIEPNLVGTDDFVGYCRRIGAEPIMAVNLGTAGMKEAAEFLEYCNVRGGTAYSDRRIKNGYREPHGIKYWCLGNEMDAQWQIGHKTGGEYARLAVETAKLMKKIDPDISLIACGSSGDDLRTFPEWEAQVLAECYERVDYISLHHYFSNADGDTATFLASGIAADSHIEQVISVCDYIKSRRRSKKTMMLAFDEYNVWYHDRDKKKGNLQIAPPLCEDHYNITDAVCLGGVLISLLRHCDRVKIACLAQLVNVIAPIITVPGGMAYRQTIYYPFEAVSRFGRGAVLDIRIKSDLCDGGKYGAIPAVDSVSVLNGDGDAVVFAVNRDTGNPVSLCIALQGIDASVISHTALYGENREAINSPENPDRVLPVPVGGCRIDGKEAFAVLPPLSWNVIKLGN